MQSAFRLLFLLIVISITPRVSFSQKGALLDRQTSITVEGNHIIKEESFLYQVDNKDAKWLGQISVPQYGNSKVQVVEANIQDQWGNVIRKLKKSEIQTESYVSDMALHEDDKLLTFNLVHNDYPYRIYYKTRSSSNQYISLANWSPIHYYGVPTVNATLTIDVPQDFEIKKDYSDIFNYQYEAMDGRIIHKWAISNFPGITKNSFAPPLDELIPWVKVVPIQFVYGIKGSSDTWADYGSWIHELNQGLHDLPPDEKITIHKLINDVDDPKTQIDIIYKYLQDNHRYILVAIDIGGLKPYPASYVVKNRYGDCKALTNYMQAALEEVGIKSYYTLINADDNAERLNLSLPSAQFNHVILCVPLENDTIWLENTANWPQANYLGTFTQNRYALFVNENQSSLIRTPKLKESDVRITRTSKIDLKEIENPKCEMAVTLGGDEFEGLNYLAKNTSDQKANNYIRKYLIPFQSFNLSNVELIKKDNSELILGFQANLNIQNMARKLPDSYAFTIPSLDFELDERPDKRLHPIRFNYPISKKDSIIYSLNLSDIGEIKIPENFSTESKFGKYEISFAKKVDQITCQRSFFLNSGDYPLDDYQELYSFIDNIKRFESSSYIILKSK